MVVNGSKFFFLNTKTKYFSQNVLGAFISLLFIMPWSVSVHAICFNFWLRKSECSKLKKIKSWLKKVLNPGYSLFCHLFIIIISNTSTSV